MVARSRQKVRRTNERDAPSKGMPPVTHLLQLAPPPIAHSLVEYSIDELSSLLVESSSKNNGKSSCIHS